MSNDERPGSENVGARDDAWRLLRQNVVRQLALITRGGAKLPDDRKPKAAVAFPLCAPPQNRKGAEFVVYFRQLVDLPLLRRPPDPEQPPESDRGADDQLQLQLACTPAACQLDYGLSLLFEQQWNLLGLEVGDLASTLGLAPGEDLTIEILNSQRKLLEQKVVDSTEEVTSTESVTSDKEVVNVARSASRTNSWKVDGTGSFSLGFFSLGLGASASETLNRAASQSLQRIHEQTVKSAHTLKTLRKIEVRGVTEGFVQHRMTRHLRNPYFDRTLSINIFELQKRFSVMLSVAEVRPVLIVRLRLDFDEAFVTSNTDFLKANLLDESLVEELEEAVRGANPPPRLRGLDDASKWASRALEFLFEEPNLFNLVATLDIAEDQIDVNLPSASFDEPWGLVEAHQDDVRVILRLDEYRSKAAYGQARRNRKTFVLFLTLAYFYRVYERLRRARLLDEQAVTFASGLAKRLSAIWTDILGGGVDQVAGDDDAARVLFDIMNQDQLEGNALTEIFRRIPGFLALMEDVVSTTIVGDNAFATNFAETVDAWSRLRYHLRCSQSYYTQRYLEYLVQRDAKRPLIELVEQAIAAQPDAEHLRMVFDAEACYVDRDWLVVPGLPLAGKALADFVALFPKEPADGGSPLLGGGGDVVVPADGVHLEVAAGACVLTDVPPPWIASPEVVDDLDGTAADVGAAAD